MSSYYHKLLEQRLRFKSLRTKKKKLYFVIAIICLILITAGVYFVISKRANLGVTIGKPTVQIQIADSVANEIKPKIDQFINENPDLKIECTSHCTKPDIVFDSQKLPTYSQAEIIGQFVADEGKYKFIPPDTLELLGFSKIWMMSQTGGKLTEKLRQFLKKDYSSQKITINFVGDIMLSRTVDEKIAEINDPRYPFLLLADFLKNADLTGGNLESPFYDQGPPIREGMVFKADPKNIKGLTYAGFDLVTLANNHFGNQGIAGMLYTMSFLKKKGIDYLGAGKNIEEAHDFLIKDINGLKIAFIGVENYSITPQSYFATLTKPGLLHVEADQIGKIVKKARKEANLVIVTYHGGTEYAPQANQNQIDFAHAAIDAGADIVIGHHPHVIQGVENYKGKMILYSLGNFVFDQMWSLETQQGLAVQLNLEDNLLFSIKLVPVHIYNFCQPKKTGILERDQIIQRILKNSDL
jgi:poly-gamma-glutamate synthesis protein (capsule biosynthesis protein)